MPSIKKFNYLLFTFLSFSLYSQKELKIDSLENNQLTFSKEFFRAIGNSSAVYYAKGNITKALRYDVIALKLALANKDPYFINIGYSNIGYDYLASNDTTLTKESFLKAEKYALLSKSERLLATSKMNLANYYSMMEQDITAIRYFQESINAYTKNSDSLGVSKASFSLAMIYLKAEDYNKMFQYISETRKHLIPDIEKSVPIAVDNYTGLYYSELKEYDKANKFFLKAIKTAEEEDYPINLELSYGDFSKSLFKQQKYKQAYEYSVKLKEISIRILEEQSTAESDQISSEFQVEQYRQDAEAAELKSQLHEQVSRYNNNLNILLLVVCICAGVLIIVLFTAYRRRKQLNEALTEKNIEYLKAKEKSEMLTKSKSDFFSTVSHELRTPLYGVIGLSTILLEDETLTSHKNDLKNLKFSADYLLALINDVLQIHKIDSNQLEINNIIFNVRDLLKEVMFSFEYMRIQNNNAIHLEISSDVPEILNGNSFHLSQILMNLIGNACKFTEHGDIFIIVETKEQNDAAATISFTIKDTGIGIDKESLKSVFDEFSQSGSPSYTYQGTGLGLPIVKKLLALYDTQIKLESDLGKGSNFSFELLFEKSNEQIEIQNLKILDVKCLKDAKILIVEDNRINQIVTKKILEKNHAVCTLANNGEEAVEIVKQSEFDLVLMDINMPIKNGIEATREIRTFNKSLTVIALTAVEVEDMRCEIYDCGMNDIIIKPYDVDKFLQTILKNITSKEIVSNN